MTRTLSLTQHRHAFDRPAPVSGDGSSLERARDGDRDAFETFYRTHAPRVYALCLRLSADLTMANELTQDVFIRAWNALPEFRGEADVTTWLHRIAVNAMLQQRRGDRRRAARVALAEDDEGGRVLERGSVVPRDVGTAIDIERAIASLPAGVRRAFVLHDIEGFTHVEIAQMTGLAEGTLRAQLHRARQLLIEALKS